MLCKGNDFWFEMPLEVCHHSILCSFGSYPREKCHLCVKGRQLITNWIILGSFQVVNSMDTFFWWEYDLGTGLWAAQPGCWDSGKQVWREVSLTDQQVGKILVQHCAALLPLMGYSSRELSTKFPDLKCNCAADGRCAQSMDLVGNELWHLWCSLDEQWSW